MSETSDLSSAFALLLSYSVIYALVYSAISDWRYRRIPNWVSLVIVASYLLYQFLPFNSGQFFDHLLIATLSLMCLVPLFAIGKMGGGDVKLITVLCLWVGPDQIVSFLILMAIFGGGLALLYLRFNMRVGLAWCCRKCGFDINIPNHGAAISLPYGIAIAFAGISTVLSQLSV